VESKFFKNIFCNISYDYKKKRDCHEIWVTGKLIIDLKDGRHKECDINCHYGSVEIPYSLEEELTIEEYQDLETIMDNYYPLEIFEDLCNKDISTTLL